jgi:uncharacterized protein
MSKVIFVNLPVRDLKASTAFYTALGATLNPQFSGEKSSCMMFSDTIGVMLLTHEHYRQFIQRPIGDARRESQALLPLSVESRDAVNATLSQATAAGGGADPARRRITASCSAAASRTWTGMCGRSCGWTRRRSPRSPRAPSSNRVRLARRRAERNGAASPWNRTKRDRKWRLEKLGAGRNPPRQLSDVVRASACNSPPIRPFKAS